jgi:nucleoside-diphosphate-sugar epimerase
VRMIGYWQALNTQKTQHALGLAEPRPLQDTLRDTLAWFRANGYLSEPPTPKPHPAAS